ncbi:hypothetical protein E4U33_007383, partial [Claviceps sp. LM78 group G4]
CYSAPSPCLPQTRTFSLLLPPSYTPSTTGLRASMLGTWAPAISTFKLSSLC